MTAALYPLPVPVKPMWRCQHCSCQTSKCLLCSRLVCSRLGPLCSRLLGSRNIGTVCLTAGFYFVCWFVRQFRNNRAKFVNFNEFWLKVGCCSRLCSRLGPLCSRLLGSRNIGTVCLTAGFYFVCWLSDKLDITGQNLVISMSFAWRWESCSRLGTLAQPPTGSRFWQNCGFVYVLVKQEWQNISLIVKQMRHAGWNCQISISFWMARGVLQPPMDPCAAAFRA